MIAVAMAVLPLAFVALAPLEVTVEAGAMLPFSVVVGFPAVGAFWGLKLGALAPVAMIALTPLVVAVHAVLPFVVAVRFALECARRRSPAAVRLLRAVHKQGTTQLNSIQSASVFKAVALVIWQQSRRDLCRSRDHHQHTPKHRKVPRGLEIGRKGVAALMRFSCGKNVQRGRLARLYKRACERSSGT